MATEPKVCDLCCHEASAWAVGFCDHAICLACCARMRVLCEQRECPVCRDELEQVVVVDHIKPYSSISTFRLQGDRKYSILFEKPELNDLYKSLRDNKCSLCKEVLRSWKFLREHARKVHDRYYCDICLENLKLFPFEFKTYTRQELTSHRRDGDPDDRSYKGHPLCKFCDERYLDNDALHAHLQKNHFWCHFCEIDGKQEFYSTYPALRQHFNTEHFLCEEGACKDEQYTSVFRSKIDLQAHRAQTHTKGLSKAEAKQLRQIELGFTFARSEEEEEGAYEYVQSRGRQAGSRARAAAQFREREEVEIVTAMSASMQHGGAKKATDSPRTERRGKMSRFSQPPSANPATNGSATANGTATAVDRKEVPRKVEQSSQQDPLSYYREVSRPQDAKKKPPGFEAIVNSSSEGSGKETVSEWPNLWPDLPGNSSKPAPVPPPRYSNAASAPPGFSQVSTVKQAPRKWQAAQTRPPGLIYPDTSRRISSDPVSGQMHGSLQLSNGLVAIHQPLPMPPPPRPSSSITEGRAHQAEIIERVRTILGHDKGKVTQFMTLTGWYKNNEITVLEYADQCYSLMGGAWNHIGPQLANVLPDKSKQKELGDFFRSRLHNGHPRKSRKGSEVTRQQPPSAWHAGRDSSKKSQLSEEDYPSLGSVPRSKQVPPGASDPWSLKVTV